MTINEALRAAALRLKPSSDTARLDAEILMAHALRVSRSDLLLRHMDGEVPAGFAELLTRREQAEPVAYITGTQGFYGREFTVTNEVLIPRGDSETIVDAALAASAAPAHVLDCGVGSGALLLSVLAERPDAHGIGIDRSLGAMAIASQNAALLGLADRARILHRDWHEVDWTEELGQFDLILANPPYVEADAALASSVREYEPGGALFAGAEGLDDYRVLIPQLRGLLTADGVVVLEIGATQEDSVAALARQSGFGVVCHHDLAGRPRALVLS